jgi:hypothetical protein
VLHAKTRVKKLLMPLLRARNKQLTTKLGEKQSIRGMAGKEKPLVKRKPVDMGKVEYLVLS